MFLNICWEVLRKKRKILLLAPCIGRKNGFASNLLSANMMQICANRGINLSKGGKSDFAYLLHPGVNGYAKSAFTTFAQIYPTVCTNLHHIWAEQIWSKSIFSSSVGEIKRHPMRTWLVTVSTLAINRSGYCETLPGSLSEGYAPWNTPRLNLSLLKITVSWMVSIFILSSHRERFGLRRPQSRFEIQRRR